MRDAFLYDLFISHTDDDRVWVEQYLLPALNLPQERVITPKRFRPGKPLVDEFEHAVTASRYTVLVLTPAYLADEWLTFGGHLASHISIDTQRNRVIPVQLKPCQLPLHIDFRVKLDCTDSSAWDSEIARLRTLLPPPPSTFISLVDSLLFTLQRWRLRHPRWLLRIGVASLIGLLGLALQLEWPPFQPRWVWLSLGLQANDAKIFARTGDVLLVGGQNRTSGCNHAEKGLWRSPENGISWQAVDAPIDFQRYDGCQLAEFTGFAIAPTLLQRVYAATAEVGLLRSDDQGQTWRKMNQQGLANVKLAQVAVDPNNADLVFVAGQAAGLYRSDDGGEEWQRLDRQAVATVCPAGAPFTQTFFSGVLAVTATYVLAGTGVPSNLTADHVPSGLYRSDDGGSCWQQLDDGANHDEYVLLAQVPATASKSWLVMTKDWGQNAGNDSWSLWRLDLTESAPRRKVLANFAGVYRALIVVNDGGLRWYVADMLGEIYRGPIAVPDQIEKLPRLTRCIRPCEVAFAPDSAQGPPLLLAAGRVYRLEQGAWWRKVWP